MCGVLLEGHIKWTTAIIWRRYQERKRFIKIILVPYFAHRVFKNMDYLFRRDWKDGTREERV